MTFTEALRQGSAVMSRTAKAHPLQLLKTLVDADPTADHQRLFRQWWKQISHDDELLEAVARYAFTNFLTTLDKDRRRAQQGPPEPRPSPAEVRTQVEQLAARVKRSVLLDFLLPDGKRLADATFAECRKAGGWLARVARRGKPKQIVGALLSEEDLQAIWKNA